MDRLRMDTGPISVDALPTSRSKETRTSAIVASVAFALLGCAIGAIWSTRWFATQDGPSHIYNAKIIARSLSVDSPFAKAYRVQWKPLPNWCGHLLAMGMLRVVSHRVAERLITTITLVGLAACILWLRVQTAGSKDVGLVCCLALLLAMNFSWLEGFVGFELGACLFAISLACWWKHRNRPSLPSLLIQALLVILGYFCHPVSWGLTLFSLIVLALATPLDARFKTFWWTLLFIAPALPLALMYRSMVSGGGAIVPQWGYLAHPWSLVAWSRQIGWVDPISLASKQYVPFQGDRASNFGAVFAPVVWFVFALPIVLTLAWQNRSRERRGWLVLAVVLTTAGLLGPDSLGYQHGQYLPQRMILLGLIALVPWLEFGPNSRIKALVALPLLVSCSLQVLMVWDYAGRCDRFGREFSSAAAALGERQRVATLLVGVSTPFRINHMLHFDCILGTDSDSVIWSNYEPTHYYFPVQPAEPRPLPELELVSIVASGSLGMDERGASKEQLWSGVLEQNADRFDKLLVWGKDPALDEISFRWFDRQPLFERGMTRVFARRKPVLEPESAALGRSSIAK